MGSRYARSTKFLDAQIHQSSLSSTKIKFNVRMRRYFLWKNSYFEGKNWRLHGCKQHVLAHFLPHFSCLFRPPVSVFVSTFCWLFHGVLVSLLCFHVPLVCFTSFNFFVFSCFAGSFIQYQMSLFNCHFYVSFLCVIVFILL